MKTKALVVSGLLLGTLLPAQEKSGAPEQGAPQQGAKLEAKKQVAGLIQDLGSDRYKTRVEAENKLREAGKDALPALRKAADSDDGEIQWRAKRLIRQIEQGDEALEPRADSSKGGSGHGGGRNQGGVAPLPPDARDRFEDMFQQLERDFGIDVPRARFFHDDFFRDIDQQFRDLQERMQKRNAQGLGGVSQGMSMQVGPNGVRVEVQEKNDKGEVENKVYEAPDMETFQKQYPDVLKEHGLALGGPNFWFGDQPGLVQPFHQLPNSGRLPAIRMTPAQPPAAPGETAATPPAEGERLGVYIRPEIASQVREYLGLEQGVGVMVESVQDDTLAAALGLEAGDIVTRIAGKAVGSPADIREVLGAIDAGKDVEVAFVRKGVEKTAKAVKKAPAVEAKPAERPRLQRRAGGSIR